MKKTLLGIATLLTVGVSAQLTLVQKLTTSRLETSLNREIGQNIIENNEFLLSYDGYGSVSFDILNSDFTIYKTIEIDTLGWSALGYSMEVAFISKHFFNSDNKIEFVYSVFAFNNAPNQFVKTVIIDEDGNQLQEITGMYLDGSDMFEANGKTYIALESNDNKLSIYEAGGVMPCLSICSSTGSTASKKAPEKVYDINLYPNPTASTITLAINTDKTNMLVHIYSMDGKLVKSASVVNGNNLIDTSALSAGTYIYNVQTDTEVIHASQFVKK
jgi:hypothetical protein